MFGLLIGVLAMKLTNRLHVALLCSVIDHRWRQNVISKKIKKYRLLSLIKNSINNNTQLHIGGAGKTPISQETLSNFLFVYWFWGMRILKINHFSLIYVCLSSSSQFKLSHKPLFFSVAEFKINGVARITNFLIICFQYNL